MKKRVIVSGICVVTALLLGAVAFEVVETQKRVISTWSELLIGFDRKNTTPPLPDIEPKTIYKMILAKDWNFMTASNNWFRIESGGTYYVSKESKELQNLDLPLTIRVYDYLPTESVYILSSKDGTNFMSEAAFKSDPLTDEEFEKLTAEEQRSDLLFKLWKKRCIWEITLKDESELLSDLLSKARSTPAPTEGGGGMKRSSSVHSNELWLSIDGQTLILSAPMGFTNRMEIFGSDTLFDPWEIEVQNLQPTYTNPATWSPSPAPMKQYYCPGDMDRDADGDGLPNDREKRIYRTNPDNPDSDGDGYSDGSTWPAGYGGVMRGLNDAFPNDAAAWRDSDLDGLPDEVVGTSTSDPQLVEDLDDDGDGTNEMTVAGIWISAEEISGLATNGVQWENLLDEANQQIYTVDISDQDEFDDVYAMAKALVYARTGNSDYRTDVIDACADAIGTEEGGRSLALGRNLGAFVIAADLVDLPQAADMEFRDWLRTCLTNVMSEGRSLTTCHEQRPNNWGTMAGGSRAAVAAYLQDWDELDRAAKVFKGYMGDTNSHNGFSYQYSRSWQADTNNPVGINPKGATINGHSVDGVLPDDQRRGGDFEWPPPKENYVYEALQGALLQATILDRAGYEVWEWEDQALLRAFNWLHDQANFTAVRDDSWQPFLMNQFYGTDFPTFTTSEHGKNAAPTCWLYPDGDPELDLEFYSDNYSNATIIGNSLPSSWRPFAADSPWNTPLPYNAPVHSNSAAIMNLVTGRVDNIRLVNSYLTPIWVVNSSNALLVSTNTSPSTNLIWTHMNSENIFDTWDEGGTNRDFISDVPIPLASTMYPEPERDGHICIVDPFKRVSYELSKYHGWTNDTPECTTFNIWDLRGSGVGDNPTNLPPGTRWQLRGGKGSGFCLIGGILRPEELEARRIRHALTFSFGDNRRAASGDDIMMYPPACRSDGGATNNIPSGVIYPIEGMRFQLDPTLGKSDFDSWGLTNEFGIALANALQEYGMYLGDNGGDMAIAVQLLGTNQASNRAEWDQRFPGFYDSVKDIPASAFRVIDDPDQEVVIK